MPFVKISREAEIKVFSNKFLVVVICVSLVSILAQASLILVSWGKLPPQIPIFYSKPWGEAILAPPVFLWILPVLAILVCAINFTIAVFFAPENIFLLRVLFIFSLIVTLITLYDSTKIISLLI